MLTPLDEHALLIFWTQLLVLVVAARAAGYAMQRVGLPSVIGHLGAGVILGPSVFGQLWASGFEWFPPPRGDLVGRAVRSHLGRGGPAAGNRRVRDRPGTDTPPRESLGPGDRIQSRRAARGRSGHRAGAARGLRGWRCRPHGVRAVRGRGPVGLGPCGHRPHPLGAGAHETRLRPDHRRGGDGQRRGRLGDAGRVRRVRHRRQNLAVRHAAHGGRVGTVPGAGDDAGPACR